MKFEKSEQAEPMDPKETNESDGSRYERVSYEKTRGYLSHEQREISAPLIEEAKGKRNRLLEKRGLLRMSKEDFDTYFASGKFDIRADLEQGNVGDCYAVAAIHAMSCSPDFEIICRSSMERRPDGTWEVRIPLLDSSGEVITITPKELSPQKNSHFLKLQRNGASILDATLDFRRKLEPVKGKEGLQVLEAAYIKKVFGNVDRLKADGGFGGDALLSLGGSNFEKYSAGSFEWGGGGEQLDYRPLGSLAGEEKAYLDNFLENFDPEIFMATTSTRMDVSQMSRETQEIKGNSASRHAYSISGVDPRRELITLANPWNTSIPITMTFEEYKRNFSSLEAIRVNMAKLLENMDYIEKAAT